MWRREVLRSNGTAKRSAEIVVAARRRYEEGLARTSIQDITNHVGVTRSCSTTSRAREEVTSARARPVRFSGGHAALAREPDGGHRWSLHSMVKIMRVVLFERTPSAWPFPPGECGAVPGLPQSLRRPGRRVHGDAPHGGADEVRRAVRPSVRDVLRAHRWGC